MKIETKKIIAREILILFASFVLLGMCFLLAEIVENYNTKQIKKEYDSIEAKIDSINSNHHSNIEKVWKDLTVNVVGFAVPLDEFVIDMAGTVKRKRLFNNLKNGKPSVVYDDFSMSYSNFSEHIGYTKELDSIRSRNLEIFVELNPLDLDVNNDDSFYWYALILYLLIYPIRGLYYILNWSIKTIKS